MGQEISILQAYVPASEADMELSQGQVTKISVATDVETAQVQEQNLSKVTDAATAQV
jgi:uncharacterized protein YqeY